MSMIARFVQVSAEGLAQLLANPSSVDELFEMPAVAVADPVRPELQRGPERLKQAAAGRQLAKMLETTLAGLDPTMRQKLEKRLGSLGVNVDGLNGGQGGEAILKLMQQRLPAMSLQPESLGGAQSEDQGRALSLDKAWHGVHFLLCGAAEPGPTLVGQAILGGIELGEDLGYGPARYFPVEQTAAIARELSRADLEAEMKARFDPARLSHMGIYPGGWDSKSADWLLGEFRMLRDFYGAAAGKGSAVVACIV
jgi:hypothetical protein